VVLTVLTVRIRFIVSCPSRANQFSMTTISTISTPQAPSALQH
jgi:hypothetical protein